MHCLFDGSWTASSSLDSGLPNCWSFSHRLYWRLRTHHEPLLRHKIFNLGLRQFFSLFEFYYLTCQQTKAISSTIQNKQKPFHLRFTHMVHLTNVTSYFKFQNLQQVHAGSISVPPLIQTKFCSFSTKNKSKRGQISLLSGHNNRFTIFLFLHFGFILNSFC
jgi:hypothetical protein